MFIKSKPKFNDIRIKYPNYASCLGPVKSPSIILVITCKINVPITESPIAIIYCLIKVIIIWKIVIETPINMCNKNLAGYDK